MLKREGSSRNCMGGNNTRTIITIDDDDDDEVLVYSPTSAPSSGAVGSFVVPRSCEPVVTEEDLELRLGFPVHYEAPTRNHDGRGEPLQSRVQTNNGRTSSNGGRSPSNDRWSPSNDGRSSSNDGHTSTQNQQAEMEGLRLTCTICMDTMKEETSTVCGHLFCKTCITDAILFQSKCPTCRKKLTMRNIHRVYLPGTSSS